MFWVATVSSCKCVELQVCLSCKRFELQKFWLAKVLSCKRFELQKFWLAKVLSCKSFDLQKFWVAKVVSWTWFELHMFWVANVLSCKSFDSQKLWVATVSSSRGQRDMFLSNKTFFEGCIAHRLRVLFKGYVHKHVQVSPNWIGSAMLFFGPRIGLGSWSILFRVVNILQKIYSLG